MTTLYRPVKVANDAQRAALPKGSFMHPDCYLGGVLTYLVPVGAEEETTTLGDLSANHIGRTRFIIRHAGSAVSGLLMGLEIETQVMHRQRLGERDSENVITGVDITITLGSITIGPLNRDYPVEAIS